MERRLHIHSVWQPQQPTTGQATAAAALLFFYYTITIFLHFTFLFCFVFSTFLPASPSSTLPSPSAPSPSAVGWYVYLFALPYADMYNTLLLLLLPIPLLWGKCGGREPRRGGLWLYDRLMVSKVRSLISFSSVAPSPYFLRPPLLGRGQLLYSSNIFLL